MEYWRSTCKSEDRLKATALLVAGLLGPFLCWEIVVIVLEVIGEVMSLLAEFIKWLLVLVMGGLSTLMTVAVLIGMWIAMPAALQHLVDAGGQASTPPRDQREAPDLRRSFRVHSTLIAGHVVILVLTLLAMAFPFTARAWRRLAGMGPV